uniref:Uncharacterized protein n=1 Tax=Streptomyces sp. NBC_00119 TaxID=2975659 RepID=A0AAU1UHN8_9ACTN
MRFAGSARRRGGVAGAAAAGGVAGRGGSGPSALCTAVSLIGRSRVVVSVGRSGGRGPAPGRVAGAGRSDAGAAGAPGTGGVSGKRAEAGGGGGVWSGVGVGAGRGGIDASWPTEASANSSRGVGGWEGRGGIGARRACVLMPPRFRPVLVLRARHSTG